MYNTLEEMQNGDDEVQSREFIFTFLEKICGKEKKRQSTPLQKTKKCDMIDEVKNEVTTSQDVVLRFGKFQILFGVSTRVN